MKYFSLLLILAAHTAVCQTPQVDSLKTNTLPSNLGIVNLSGIAMKNIPMTTSQNFNSGNIHDPLQLIQGRVSGLLIAKPGNDPNAPFSARIRGVNSVYLSTAPLITVDGMPYSSLLNVDPLDISNITVVKDAANASLFGMGGQNGVIAIETFRGKNHGLRVKHYTSLEIPNLKPGRAMSRDEYIDMGGVDLGGNTNWEDEITRTGVANVTHVSYGAQKASTEFYVGLNHRDVNGMLDNSGFKSLNGNVKVTQTLIADKLFVSGQASMTKRKSDFSFVEAFKNARTFLPTSPIRTANNSGYADYMTFENNNPREIIDLDTNDGETNILRYNFNVNYKITPSFEITGGYGSEDQQNENRKYWAKEGHWWSSGGEGRRQQYNQYLKTNLAFFTANFSKRYEQSQLDISGGVMTQNLDLKDEQLLAYGFETNEQGLTEVSDITEFPYGTNRFTETYDKNQGSTRYHASINWSNKDRLFLGANLSKEAYNDNIKAGAAGLSFGYDLIGNKNGSLTQLKPRISFGRTANARTFRQSYNPRDITQSWRWPGNAKMKPEKKTELALGADMTIKNVNSSLTFFTATTKDVLSLDNLSTPGQQLFEWNSAGKIRNKGIELDVNWFAVRKENLTITTGLNLSMISNRYLTERPLQQAGPLEFVLGMGGSWTEFSLENDKPVGQMYTLKYEGFNDNGTWKFGDTNNSGGLDYYGDFSGHGRPLPSAYFGWSTQVKYNRLTANILFRGAFGHEVFNAFRMGYEDDFLISSYNAPATLIGSPRLNVTETNRPSTYYLERANYFTVDNLGVQYDLFQANKYKFDVAVNFAVQNLFTVTNYSGVSPEVRLDYDGDQVGAGFESQNTYRPARTILLGLNFRL